MLFQLNFKSGKAVYLQLVDQVKLAAASGTLQAGDALPAIRPLAEELRVNRNTVAKAYAELESQGVIETIVGKGCFVRTTQLAVQERRAAEAPGRIDRRRGGPRASPPDRQGASSCALAKNDSTHLNRSERVPRMCDQP